MSFRSVPKSVTLNDLEWRNGPYFALFHRIFVYDVVIKQLGLPRDQNLLFLSQNANQPSPGQIQHKDKLRDRSLK